MEAGPGWMEAGRADVLSNGGIRSAREEPTTMRRQGLLVTAAVTAVALVMAQGDLAAQPPGGQGPVSAQPAPGALQAAPRGLEVAGPTTLAQPGPIGAQRPQVGARQGQAGPAQQEGVVAAKPSLTQLRTPTELKVLYTIGAIGATVNLRAELKLRAEGKPVPNHTVRFRVNGASVGADKTNGQGVAQIAYKVPNEFGARKVEAEFAGTQSCTAARDDGTLGVVKSSTKMTLALLNPNQPIREGGTVHVNGRIVRITDQTGLDGREIPVKVDGKEVTRLATSPSGAFAISYKVPAGYGVKTGKIEAGFEGDTLYVPTVASLDFSVKPKLVKAWLLWGGAEGKVGQTVTLSAMLGTANPPLPNHGIGGKSVRFWRERDARWAAPHIASKTLGTATTNSSGIAKLSFKIDDKALGYSIYAHVDGVLDELSVEKLYAQGGILKVHKAPVNIAVSGPGSGQIGQTLTLKARVTRATDGAPVKEAQVQVPGSPAKVTDASGEVSFSYTISSGGGIGTRTVQVTSKEDDRHLAGAGSKTLQATAKTN